tara:strand:- start:32633 stop:33367 length:735 start_codon:yes stop_codon:yes gene_type:complete
VISGVGYYTGDISPTHYENSRLAGGITYRKNLDRRFTFKSSMLYTNIYADDANSSNPIKINRNLKFKSDLIELSGQIEFNFLPYETGNSLYSWSPYIFTGASIFRFNPMSEASDGRWYSLQELGTEGQGTDGEYSYRKQYSLTQISIPFGGGVKIGINENFNIILEYGLRKTFTDYIDDISTTYVGVPVEWSGDEITIELADRSLDGPQQSGIARGDDTTKDWYSFSGITLSFTLKGNSKECNY